jgi:hypothetical protein
VPTEHRPVDRIGRMGGPIIMRHKPCGTGETAAE